MRRTLLLVLCVGLGWNSTSATASDWQLGGETAVPSRSIPKLTLARGGLQIDGIFLTNLSAGDIGEPISVSPDIWYGLNDVMTFGLVHSLHGTTGFWGIDTLGGPRGTSLCLTSQSGNCAEIYSNFAFLLRYSIVSVGNLHIGATGGLIANTFDPLAISVKVGAQFRGALGERLLLELTPSLFVGVTERSSGNIERATLPVTSTFSLDDRLAVLFQAGIIFSFENAADNVAIPVSLGGSYSITESIGVTGVFSFPALFGGDSVTSSGFDGRALTLGLHWRH